jgi:dephospho-CoA kinase
MNKVQYVGISGTNGAGKDTVGEVLKKHGFFVASATEMLADGLKEKGWPIDREHKAKLSTEWRRQFGMGAVVDQGLKLYEPVADQYQGFGVGSLRHPGEADRIHALPGGVVIWVDADPKIRYERVMDASRGANKAGEDSVTYEEFLVQQEAEMHHKEGDTATLSIADVKIRADITLFNNDNDIEAFKQGVEKALGLA